MEKDFANLRFNLTEDMNRTFIELLLITQMLENKKHKKKINNFRKSENNQ